jgi:adenylate cyclase
VRHRLSFLRIGYNFAMKSFWKELSRRKVTRVALAYLILSWLVLQVADVILPALGLPEWSITLVLALLVLGFPIALVLSWVFDLDSKGIKRTSNADRNLSDLSIAALPFLDLSPDQSQAYFCDGLTDELISWLTNVPGLRVASRSSSFAFKDRDVDLKSAAEKLQVAHILEGGVRKDGERLRISAQLTDVADNSVLWAENYDRDLSDIFAIQQDIASRIQEALKLQFGTIDAPGTETQNAKAYEYYLRARGYALYNGRKELKLAQKMYEKAIEADPRFVDAWVGLAEVAALQALFLDGGEAARLISDNAGTKAMELSPDEGASYMARGYGQLACECYAAAEKAFLNAVQLEPKLYRAWHYLGRTAHHAGDQEKEIEYFKRAAELDPDDWESPILVLSPMRQLGLSSDVEKMARLAVERVQTHLEDYPDNQRAYYLGIGALLILQETDQAKDWAEQAYKLAPDDPPTRYNLACFYSQMGDVDKALDLLQHSVTSRSWMENDHDLDNIRDHPRFKQFLASLPEGS